MRIAVVSDTHSRYATVKTVLNLLRDDGIETILHCGDIEDAATVKLFSGFQTHFVFGNCDHDRRELERAMAEIGATSHGDWGQLELEGRQLAFTHGDDKGLLRDLQRGDCFDFLFYGHSHEAAEHATGRTRVINPGALHRATPKSFLLLSLADGSTESIKLE